ncbi:hypothetical protein [Streptosporangium sp. NPDC000396]|uniref:hypothetical protein n=1 Tax=Streptosporangium sp. NPDC000396 TaxID=3366185 RepID=UPI0036CEBC76
MSEAAPHGLTSRQIDQHLGSLPPGVRMRMLDALTTDGLIRRDGDVWRLAV